MTKRQISDPRWKELSASLRQGNLYIKLPRNQVFDLLKAFSSTLIVMKIEEDPDLSVKYTYLTTYIEFLTEQIKKILMVAQTSVVYSTSQDQTMKDVACFKVVEHLDKSGRIFLFRNCLEAGLRGDPEVDWITRVEGPKIRNPKVIPEPTEEEVIELVDITSDLTN